MTENDSLHRQNLADELLLATKRQEQDVGRHTKDRTEYSAPALSKGLEILEVLSMHETGLSLKELAQALEKTVSEIFRMVAVLEGHGYIRLSTDGRYVLTLRLFEVAHRHPPIKSLIESAAPLMHQLSDEIRQECHLSIYQGGKAIVIAQVESPERWSFNVKVGAMLELVEAASGLVMLAFQTGERRQKMLDECKSVVGELPERVKHLEDDLCTIKSLGHCIMESQHVAGVTNIASPILGADGYAVATLAVSYVKRISGTRSIPLEYVPRYLRNCALEVSKVNGYTPR